MVTPYFTQQSPPALVAVLPPIEQISNDDGSGGYHRPCSAAAALTCAFIAPGSVTTVRVTGRIARETSMTPMGHLTCVGHTRAELERILDSFREAGVRTVLALRGDPPDGPGTSLRAQGVRV